LTITLLTDFGYSDPYAAAMKGVILRINPEAAIVDITHDVTPHNVDEAGFIIESLYKYFPDGTIHVVVVDPGVGSERAILVVQTSNYIFIAPDNGVLKYIFNGEEGFKVYRLKEGSIPSDDISSTFHGRDIFAPLAARISLGEPIDSLCRPFSGFLRGEVKRPVIDRDRIVGQIIYVDRFGTCVTNIEECMLGNRNVKRIEAGLCRIDRMSSKYVDVPKGSPLALIGSSGRVEISINQDSAKERFGLNVGDRVVVTLN